MGSTHKKEEIFNLFLATAPSVKGTGEIGVVYVAEPLDACQNLMNKPEQSSNETSPFVLIVRGGCSFEEKVRKAQRAGFKAAIIYDNEDRGTLIASMKIYVLIL